MAANAAETAFSRDSSVADNYLLQGEALQGEFPPHWILALLGIILVVYLDSACLQSF